MGLLGPDPGPLVVLPFNSKSMLPAFGSSKLCACSLKPRLCHRLCSSPGAAAPAIGGRGLRVFWPLMADDKPVYYTPGPWNKTSRDKSHTPAAHVWGHDDAPNQKSPGELEELMGRYLHGIPADQWRPGRTVEYGAFHKLHSRDKRLVGMMVYESMNGFLWKFNIIMAADDELANIEKIEEKLRDYPMLAIGSSQRVAIHKFQKPTGNHASDYNLQFRTWKCRSCAIGLTMHGDLTRSGNERGLRHAYIQSLMNTTNPSLAQEMANLLCHLVLYTPPYPKAFGGLECHKGHMQHLVRSPSPSSPAALPSAPRPPSSSGSRGAAPVSEPVQIPSTSIAPQVRQPLPPQPPSWAAASQPPTPVELPTSIPPPPGPQWRPLAPGDPPPLTSVPLSPPGDWGHVAPAGAATPPTPCVKLPPYVSSILPAHRQGPTQECWPQAPAKMEVDSEIPLGQGVSEFLVELPVAQETPPEPTNSLPSTQEESAMQSKSWLGFAWKSWKPPPSFFARSICHD